MFLQAQPFDGFVYHAGPIAPFDAGEYAVTHERPGYRPPVGNGNQLGYVCHSGFLNMPAWPFTIYANRPSSRLEETQRKCEHRRLPGTVGSRNAEDLTTLNGHGKTFQRMRRTRREEIPVILGYLYEFDQERLRDSLQVKTHVKCHITVNFLASLVTPKLCPKVSICLSQPPRREYAPAMKSC